MGILLKSFSVTICLLFYFAPSLYSQNEFDIRFQLDSVVCSEPLVCYKVQVRSSNGQNWGLAGQNYRLYYDGALASFQFGRSLLPTTYQNFTLIQDIQDIDASAINGNLSFSSSLSFLNYTMDLNDIVNGGISLSANSDWVTTSQLCFTVDLSLLNDPGVCLEAIWARENLTNEYATSFVEISEWIATNNTESTIGGLYDDLDASDGDMSCLNGYCILPDTITVSLRDTCLDANTYELPTVKRVEICQPSTNINLTFTNECVSFHSINPVYFGTDTICVLMCDTLRGMEICDTTTIITIIPPLIDTCPDTPFIFPITEFACEQQSVELKATTYIGLTVVYNWIKDGTPIPNSNTHTLVLDTVSIADAGNYQVMVMTSRCTLISPIHSLEIFEKPVLTVAPVPPITCVTGAEDLQLDAIITSGTGSFHYEWIGPNEFYSVNEDPVLINLNKTMDGSYTVFATNESGCSPDAFTIEIDITEGIQEPIITANTPACEGENVQLITQEYQGTNVSYEWRKNGQILDKIANNEWTIFPLDAIDIGEYQVFVEVDGCTNMSDVFSLEIYQSPKIEISPIDSISCTNGFEELTIHATPIGGTAPFIYNWEGPNGFHDNSLSPVLINLDNNSSGTYAVTITDFNNCSSKNSIYLDVKTGISQPNITTNGVVCEGEAITFSMEALIGTNISYEWTGPNNKSTANSDFPNAPSITIHSANLEDSGSYNLEVTVDGCSAKANGVVAFVQEKAKATPTNNGGLCGTRLELFANPDFSNDDNYVFQWTGPNDFTSNLENPIIENPDARNEGSYSLIITDKNGCVSNLVAIEVTLISTNLNQPFIQGENLLCQGEQLILSTVQISGQNVTYEWIGPNNTSTTNGDYLNSPILKIDNATSNNSGDYQVQVHVDGCQTIASTILLVEVYDFPSIQLSNSGTACLQSFEDIQLFATPNDINPNLTYKWVGPNGFLSTHQNPILPNASNDYSGTYTLTVANSNGCEQTLSIVLDVSLTKMPTLSLNANKFCEGEDLLLQTTAFQGENVQYYWRIIGDTLETYTTTNPTLYLDNLNSTQSGLVEVTVEIDGCLSQPSTSKQLMVYPAPELPNLDIPNAVCEGTSILLSTNTIADSYQWTGPNGFTATVQQPRIIENVDSKHVGIYILKIISNGCASAPVSKAIGIYEKPIQPILETDKTLCAGEPIRLLVSNSVSATTYQWIPPSLNANQFPDNQNELRDSVLWTNRAETIITATEFPQYYESGTWSVRSIDINGCISDSSPTSFITINPKPETPILSQINPVCKGTSFQLMANNLPDNDNVTYQWMGPNGFISNLVSPIIEPANSSNDGTYTLSISIERCTSATSMPVFLQVKPSPNIPEITANSSVESPLCEGQTLQLATPLQQGVNYLWTGPDGFNSNLPNPFIANITATQAGYYSLRVEQDNCFSTSAIVEVGVQTVPNLPTASNNSPVCTDDNLVLNVVNPLENTTYEWFKADENEFVGTGAVLGLENVDIRDAGIYYVLASSGNCSTSINVGTEEIAQAFTEAIIKQPSKEVAYIEADIFYTCEQTVNLIAKESESVEGFWSVIDNGSSAKIIFPNNATTPVENLQFGQNTFVWSIESGVCGITSSDTLIVEKGIPPIANNDTLNIGINEVINLPLLANDENWFANVNIYTLSELALGKILRNPINSDSTSTPVATSPFSYTPNENAVGTEVFTYQICNKECPDLCSEATVFISIGEDSECFAPHLLTPNNDGQNDSFIIPCLINYTQSSFTAFNRWGDEVYHSDNYQNDWDGAYNDALLPAGTYYYILNINDDTQSVLKGYIFLQR